jgi:hypothetical protein
MVSGPRVIDRQYRIECTTTGVMRTMLSFGRSPSCDSLVRKSTQPYENGLSGRATGVCILHVQMFLLL